MSDVGSPADNEDGEGPPPDLDAARRVARAAQIHDVRLLWVNAARNKRVGEFLNDWMTRGEGGFDARVLRMPDSRKTFQVHVFFYLEANVAQEGDEPVDASPNEASEQQADLDVSAVFELDYSIETTEDFDDAALRSFALVNGVFNAWSYWRELASSLTGRLGITPVTLPLYRVPAPATEPREAKSEE